MTDLRSSEEQCSFPATGFPHRAFRPWAILIPREHRRDEVMQRAARESYLFVRGVPLYRPECGIDTISLIFFGFFAFPAGFSLSAAKGSTRFVI
jgi:hypothetical protein